MPLLEDCELPERASDLIELAIRDLERVELDPRYVVDLGIWHEPQTPVDVDDLELIQADLSESDKSRVAVGKSVCAVCLAGAVMAKTCEVSPDSFTSPDYFPKRVQDRLCGLDYFRGGAVIQGLMKITKRSESELSEIVSSDEFDIPPRYKDDPEGFKRAMLDMAQILRERGL